MTPEDYVRDSWKGDSASKALPQITELRERADKFRSKIVRRNRFEYSAGVLVITVFAVLAWLVPIETLRIAAALLIGGIGVVMWQLHRRTTPLTPPENGGQLTVLEYRRRELVRQRDALKSTVTWYLLPLVPGAAVLLAMPVLEPNWPLGNVSTLDLIIRPFFALAVLGAVYAINQISARKLQHEIDEIDALRNC